MVRRVFWLGAVACIAAATVLWAWDHYCWYRRGFKSVGRME